MAYDPSNIFNKIIRKEIPAKIIYENEHMMSFYDITPACKDHALSIPKGPYENFVDFTSRASSEEIVEFYKGINRTVELLGLPKGGFRLITNNGRFANQEVPHFHFHILGGEPLGGLLGLPTKIKA